MAFSWPLAALSLHLTTAVHPGCRKGGRAKGQTERQMDLSESGLIAATNLSAFMEGLGIGLVCAPLTAYLPHKTESSPFLQTTQDSNQLPRLPGGKWNQLGNSS